MPEGAPQSPLPDAPPNDKAANRLNLDVETQWKLLEFIFRDFAQDANSVKAVALAENARRWAAYGPCGWGAGSDELYLNHCVTGHGQIPEASKFKVDKKAAAKKARVDWAYVQEAGVSQVGPDNGQWTW